MKLFLLLLALAAVCSADFYIECHGRDDLMLTPQILRCRSAVKQACYSRDNGEKGCAVLDLCARPGWRCCYSDRCNL
ncbi:uncharacterized protein wu:fj16a03 [Phyllopteryx taeniolatus]|uniref:uncharacterized protein wu:fj16a03 n=1 Tax=Phyllopteryx taeniolatus TaxID=161469 RepID=UPI002AD2A844|nr:uncharacterized protein wu:fj16a03 [Phyllopteryx taeniolatus]